MSVRRLAHGPFFLACAAAFVGCSPEATDAGEAFTVRDSAGVTIVENHAPAWQKGEAWTILDSVTLQLGQVDGPPEYTFTSPTAIELSDGRILVADSDFRELRYYDATGEWLATSGREGPGPGEFIWLGPTFAVTADTLVATDHSSGRVSVFDETGSLVETIQLEQRGGQIVVVGPVETWLWAATTSLAAPDSAGLRGRLQEIVLYAANGAATAVVDTLTHYRWLERGREGGTIGTILPFGPRPSAATSPGKVYVTSSDRYEIRQYDRDGVLRRIIRRTWEPRAVTDRDVAAHMDRVRKQFERFDTRPSSRAALLELNEQAARLSASKPAISGLRTDRAGNLWVQRWTGRRGGPRETPATPYDVFDRDGRWLGEVVLPSGYWITDIGDSYVWTMWSDELEVNFARRLPLNKPDA